MSAVVADAVVPAKGILRANVPYSRYVQYPGERISSLKEMQRSPMHYRWRMAHPKEAKPLQLGKAAHTAVLEPDAFESRYAIWSRRSEKSGSLCPRNGQHWDAFRAANPGREVITEDEQRAAQDIADAIHGDAIAMRYLSDGFSEVSMVHHLMADTDTPVVAKCRQDHLTQVGKVAYQVELKTSAAIEVVRFGNSAAKFGYHMQLAWQHDLHEAITGVSATMIVVAVESYPPHDVVVYRVPEDVLLQGREDYQRLLTQLLECQRTGSWPGVAGGAEQELSLPAYVYGGDEDLSELLEQMS
jgi:hypothetical protein